MLCKRHGATYGVLAKVTRDDHQNSISMYCQGRLFRETIGRHKNPNDEKLYRRRFKEGSYCRTIEDFEDLKLGNLCDVKKLIDALESFLGEDSSESIDDSTLEQDGGHFLEGLFGVFAESKDLEPKFHHLCRSQIYKMTSKYGMVIQEERFLEFEVTDGSGEKLVKILFNVLFLVQRSLEEFNFASLAPVLLLKIIRNAPDNAKDNRKYVNFG